jgi:hypothetical protein
LYSMSKTRLDEPDKSRLHFLKAVFVGIWALRTPKDARLSVGTLTGVPRL